MSVVLIYKNDDAAYEAWYDAHHGSYAVNVHPGGTMLHRIPCSHIGRESTRPEHLLTANRKVCSESRGALLELAPEFGWRLSSVCRVNPTPTGRRYTTSRRTSGCRSLGCRITFRCRSESDRSHPSLGGRGVRSKDATYQVTTHPCVP